MRLKHLSRTLENVTEFSKAILSDEEEKTFEEIRKDHSLFMMAIEGDVMREHVLQENSGEDDNSEKCDSSEKYEDIGLE